MSDDREARLLLAILRHSWDAAENAARDCTVDPGRFVDLCRRCDVHPWVHAELEREDRFDLVGVEVRDALAAMRHRCRSDNLLLLARAEQTLDLLLGAGIQPLALKGLDVLHRLYDRFDERAIDDVDLLVRPHEVESAIDVLERAGYRGPRGAERTHWLRSSFEMPLSSPGPVSVLVEIHWSLGQERRYTVPLEPVLERAVPLDVAGREILRLETHDAVAHLLLHHLQHYFDRRLKWMLELRRMVGDPEFRWELVARRLEDWGGRAAAGMALVHLRKLFPDAVPADARESVPTSWWRQAATLPLRSSHPLDLFRGTRNRRIQLYLAAVLLERPLDLPGYLLHRGTRDRNTDSSVVERGNKSPPGEA